MNSPPADAPDAAFVETPRGIFTVGGVWFHTTEAALRAYAGPVVEREGLPSLFALATAWLHSPRTLTLWLLPAVLVAGPVVGGVSALAFFVAWTALSPAAVPPAGARLVQRLESVLLQAAYYIFVLSIFAGGGATTAAVVGLAGFVLLRWGLVERAVQPLATVLHRRMYPLPAPDQVLRGLLVRLAIRHGAPPPAVRRMEQDILAAMRRTRP